MSSSDSKADAAMRRALALARRGRGRVEPNPMVGAVLVRDGQIVAQGYHHQFGDDHAEIDLFHQAKRFGIDPIDCHLYVTLEPCCHHGKTPPCTDAILAAGIRRLSVAMLDPHPQVAGRGIAQLEQAGVRVDIGNLEGEARRLNAPFIKRVETGLPWVILKWAQTLDGKIATASRDSRWISNDVSRRHVHHLRARMDAIMAGVGTVMADDPLLTARDVPVKRRARRVVVDPRLRISTDSTLLRSLGDNGPPVTVAAQETALDSKQLYRSELEARGVECIAIPEHNLQTGELALRPLLVHLAERHGATNVLVEGGAGLFGRMLGQQLVDQVLVFVAARLLGDVKGILPVSGFSRDRMSQTDMLQLRQVKRIGDDVLLDYACRL